MRARSHYPLLSLCFFRLIWKTKWLPRSLIDWDYSTFPLKPLNGIQRKLTGTKISTSSTKFAFFWPISKQKWPPWLILQKGSTLYSGARYVALWASCYTVLLTYCFVYHEVLIPQPCRMRQQRRRKLNLICNIFKVWKSKFSTKKWKT